MTRTRVGDAAIARGASSLYTDVARWRRRLRDTRPVHWYALLARRHGGPVLDLGCGEGRLLRALVGNGIEAVGVDASVSLARAAGAAVGDLRAIRLGRTFRGVVMGFHVVNHLVDAGDLAAALETCRVHLEPDGWLAFDVRWVTDLRPGHTMRRGTTSRAGRRVATREERVVDAFRGVELTSVFADGDDEPLVLAHRLWQPPEIATAMAVAGFAEIRWTADWSDDPPDDATQSLCIFARSASAR